VIQNVQTPAQMVYFYRPTCVGCPRVSIYHIIADSKLWSISNSKCWFVLRYQSLEFFIYFFACVFLYFL